MKEQYKSDAATMEEGLQPEKQKYINKVKCNRYKQWIRYIKLIFLLNLILFFGWGCYMILQNYLYYFQIIENITDEKYLPVFESVSEIQKSHLTTEMPVIFINPEATNNFPRGIKSAKKQDKIIVKGSITSTQNFISKISNNVMKTSDINNSSIISKDLAYDKKFMKNLMPWKTFVIKYDKIISTNKNKDSDNYEQFFEKLQNIAKLIISDQSSNDQSVISNLKQFQNKYDFIEDANCLMLNNQKYHALDTSNKIENLELDITTTSNVRDFMDFKINFENSVQNSKPLFSDLNKETQDDHDEKSSLRDGTDEQINVSLKSDVIYPPYISYESSDMSLEHPVKSFSISQPKSALEQIKNVLSDDDDVKNKDKHDADDSNMSMSVSFDVSGNKHFAFDTQIPIVKNIKDHHSSEITNTEQEEERYKLIKNIEPSFNFEFSQPRIQNNVESSTSNIVKFQWFNAPPIFANDLQLESKDILESSKIQNSSSGDTIENTETINAFIPEQNKSSNQCYIEIKMNAFKIKCPEILFNEEWNLASSGAHTEDFSNVNFKDNFNLSIKNYDNDYDNFNLSMNNYNNDDDNFDFSKNNYNNDYDNFDFSIDDYNNDYEYKDKNKSEDEIISNENSDKKIGNLQYNVPKVIEAVELQENISNVKSLKDAFSFIFKINSFNKTKVDKHDAINHLDKEKIKQEISSSSTTISNIISEYDSDTINFNKKVDPLMKIFDTQQQKQLKVTKEQDFLNSKDAKTFLKRNENVYALEKKLTFIFNDEMINVIKQQYLSKKFFQDDYICSIFHYICFPSPNLWREQYVDLKKFLKYNYDNLSDIRDGYNYRKKRMVDDLIEQKQYEEVSNSLETVNKNVNLSKNLKKFFQKMEIFAAYIDRLHKHHLLNNKVEDDYGLNQFSRETKKIE